MANPEHVEIVKQGASAIAKWRESWPDVRLDLSSADFAGAELGDVSLIGADMSGANVFQVNLVEANLRGANLRGANLDGATLIKANLLGANLISASLIGANLGYADFTEASLCEANLSGANLRGTNLGYANLSEANLSEANLNRANLLVADLTSANLSGAELQIANFLRTTLKGTKFRNAVAGSTNFSNIDLSNAVDLESVLHIGPSTIGIDTLYQSRGLLPDSFLRGCGVPEPMITYYRSLIEAQNPLQLQFYSCFISYSHNDEAFCKQLHQRMRTAGLRVWFAPEDMKGGDKIRPQVEKALHEQDKLLVVLSEESMNSNWVKHEIKQSHKRAVAEQRNVLFPIRMVPYDAVLKWSEFDHSAAIDIADEIRSYHILDFSGWENPEQFEKAFQKLLVDLRKVEPPKV